MNDIARTLALGFVTIGLATTLFASDRKTGEVVKNAGNAVSGVFGTVISGKTTTV